MKFAPGPLTRPEPRGLRGIFGVSSKGKEEEESTENVFPFGNPSHRFDVKRVKSEKGGYDGAAGDGPGPATEQDKKQKRIRCVEGQIDQMRAGGRFAEHLAIEHMGEPR